MIYEIDKGELRSADDYNKQFLGNNGVEVDKHIIKQLYEARDLYRLIFGRVA